MPAYALLARPDGALEFVNCALMEACDVADCADTPGRCALDALVPAEVAELLLAPEGATRLRGALQRKERPAIVAEWSSTWLPDGEQLVLITGRDVSREARLEEYIISNQWYETAAALSGGLAHEFNNILAAVLGLAEIISMRLPAESPLQAFAGKIGASVERAKSLVRRFSQFSRKSTGLIDAQPTVMILTEIGAAVRGFLPGHVSFTTELDAETPWCRVDRHVLEHILLNCTNLLRARMRNDGGRVLLAGRGSEDRSCVVIKLRGTGEGLAGLDLERLFDLDLGTSDTAYDSGTGLFTARLLAKRSDGHLRLQRDDARTITFTLNLPTAP